MTGLPPSQSLDADARRRACARASVAGPLVALGVMRKHLRTILLQSSNDHQWLSRRHAVAKEK
jgi:hypothetical protein